MGKILENMVTKSADPESPTLTETIIVDDSESEVEEPGPEFVAKLTQLQEERFSSGL